MRTLAAPSSVSWMILPSGFAFQFGNTAFDKGLFILASSYSEFRSSHRGDSFFYTLQTLMRQTDFNSFNSSFNFCNPSWVISVSLVIVFYSSCDRIACHCYSLIYTVSLIIFTSVFMSTKQPARGQPSLASISSTTARNSQPTGSGDPFRRAAAP